MVASESAPAKPSGFASPSAETLCEALLHLSAASRLRWSRRPVDASSKRCCGSPTAVTRVVVSRADRGGEIRGVVCAGGGCTAARFGRDGLFRFERGIGRSGDGASVSSRMGRQTGRDRRLRRGGRRRWITGPFLRREGQPLLRVVLGDSRLQAHEVPHEEHLSPLRQLWRLIQPEQKDVWAVVAMAGVAGLLMLAFR